MTLGVYFSYSSFAIQNAFKSNVVLIDEVSDVTGPAPIAMEVY